MSGTKEHWNAYCNATKVAQYECRKAHNTVFKNLELSYPSKRLFSCIKGQCKDCNGVPALEVNENIFTSNLAKSEEFNRHLVLCSPV